MTKTLPSMAPIAETAASSADRQAFADLLQRHRGLLAKVIGTYAWHA